MFQFSKLKFDKLLMMSIDGYPHIYDKTKALYNNEKPFSIHTRLYNNYTAKLGYSAIKGTREIMLL